MITSRRRKTLLVSAVLISISGFSVFAEAPQMAGAEIICPRAPWLM